MRKKSLVGSESDLLDMLKLKRSKFSMDKVFGKGKEEQEIFGRGKKEQEIFGARKGRRSGNVFDEIYGPSKKRRGSGPTFSL